MTLISLDFLLLVLGTCVLYFLVPKKWGKYQWVVLLAASLFFYIFTCNVYVIYLFVTIITTYFAGILLQNTSDKAQKQIDANKEVWSKEEKKAFKSKTQNRKKWIVAGILILNFGILAAVKYLDFLLGEIGNLLNLVGINTQMPVLNLILPLGISFYTFQAMGYIIDVYRKKANAERNVAKFALFVSFFPQIIQGPISIYGDLAPQLYAPHRFNYERFKSGGTLILWGIFKKLVIADRMVALITEVSTNYSEYTGTFYLFTIFLYAIQLYADFSGGIDICRGIAEVIGIYMPENFKRPYLSKTLTEYWHRWHITLGAWLRNYLFYPLSLSKAFLKMGKNLKKISKHLGKVLPTAIASLITFIIIGLWHGANMKYLAFGVWNGVAILVSSLMQNVDKKLLEKLHININNIFYKIFAVIRTMFFVLIGYYFDVATDLNSALYMIGKSFSDLNFTRDFWNLFTIDNANFLLRDFCLTLFFFIIIYIAWIYEEKKGVTIREKLLSFKLPVQWIIYAVLIMSIIVFGHYGPNVDPAEFVYMQF